jgi:hypothetical protein
MPALTASDLPKLTLLSKGKVRDIYATSDPNALLFVATDRISAYDVILTNVGVLLFFWAVLLGLRVLYTPVLER